MARNRTISPHMWEDTNFLTLELPAQLLWIGLISHADDAGRLEASPAALRGQVLRGHAVTLEQVRGWRDAIVALGMACLYTVEGRAYLHLPSWGRDQYVNRPRQGVIPPCPRCAAPAAPRADHPEGPPGPAELPAAHGQERAVVTAPAQGGVCCGGQSASAAQASAPTHGGVPDPSRSAPLSLPDASRSGAAQRASPAAGPPRQPPGDAARWAQSPWGLAESTPPGQGSPTHALAASSWSLPTDSSVTVETGEWGTGGGGGQGDRSSPAALAGPQAPPGRSPLVEGSAPPHPPSLAATPTRSGGAPPGAPAARGDAASAASLVAAPLPDQGGQGYAGGGSATVGWTDPPPDALPGRGRRALARAAAQVVAEAALTDDGADAEAVELLRRWAAHTEPRWRERPGALTADLRLLADLDAQGLNWRYGLRAALRRPTDSVAYVAAAARGRQRDLLAAAQPLPPPLPTAAMPYQDNAAITASTGAWFAAERARWQGHPEAHAAYPELDYTAQPCCGRNPHHRNCPTQDDGT